MRVHIQLGDDDFARLVELAAGRLSVEEEGRVRRHLEVCATCRDHLGWIEELAGEMRGDTAKPSVLEASPAEDPDLDARAWERIRSSIELDSPRQPWQRWEPVEDDSLLVRQAAASGEWQPTSIDGIEVRRLAVDRSGASLTMLIRMAAGTCYPAHEHAGPEECYVLEGDLVVGDLTMQAGDYQRMEAGTEHPDQRTEGGCLLMLRSSSDDRLIRP